MMKSAGELMLSAQTGMSILRAEIGALEEYTDTAKARNSAALSGFEIARGSMYQADPYQAADRAGARANQLEAVYTLTARLSRLSLSDYLKMKLCLLTCIFLIFGTLAQATPSD